MNEELQAFVGKATAGDKKLETFITEFLFCKPYQSPAHTENLVQELLDFTQFSSDREFLKEKTDYEYTVYYRLLNGIEHE